MGACFFCGPPPKKRSRWFPFCFPLQLQTIGTSQLATLSIHKSKGMAEHAKEGYFGLLPTLPDGRVLASKMMLGFVSGFPSTKATQAKLQPKGTTWQRFASGFCLPFKANQMGGCGSPKQTPRHCASSYNPRTPLASNLFSGRYAPTPTTLPNERTQAVPQLFKAALLILKMSGFSRTSNYW